MLSNFRLAIVLALKVTSLAGCGTPAAPQPDKAAWGRKVAAAVEPYIEYPSSKPVPALSAEFFVWLAPHGVITDKMMFNSSGVAEWDLAASLALRNVYRLPPDNEGNVPYRAIISMTPSHVGATAMKEPRPDRPEIRPSASYGEKVAAMVRRNVVFPDPDSVPGNPGAEFELRLGADGAIASVALARTSGFPDWDAAALRALRKTERLPVDVNGVAPSRLFVTMRPKR